MTQPLLLTLLLLLSLFTLSQADCGNNPIYRWGVEPPETIYASSAEQRLYNLVVHITSDGVQLCPDDDTLLRFELENNPDGRVFESEASPEVTFRAQGGIVVAKDMHVRDATKSAQIAPAIIVFNVDKPDFRMHQLRRLWVADFPFRPYLRRQLASAVEGFAVGVLPRVGLLDRYDHPTPGYYPGAPAAPLVRLTLLYDNNEEAPAQATEPPGFEIFQFDPELGYAEPPPFAFKEFNHFRFHVLVDNKDLPNMATYAFFTEIFVVHDQRVIVPFDTINAIMEPTGATAPDKLAGSYGGQEWRIQPVLQLIDVEGRPYLGPATFTIRIAEDPIGDSRLLGTTTQAAVDGIVTFTDVFIQRRMDPGILGDGFRLIIDVQLPVQDNAQVTVGPSPPFTIFPTGPPTRIVITRQPPSVAEVGAPFSVRGTIVDPGGDKILATYLELVFSLVSGSSSSNPVAPLEDGEASWSIAVDTVGSNRLQISSRSLQGAPIFQLPTASSNSFQVAAGPLAILQFSTQPSSTTSSIEFSPTPVVRLLDEQGNLRTQDSTTVVSVTIAGGTLVGPTTHTAAEGIVRFTGMAVQSVGNFKLDIAAGTITATSNSFTISPGPTAQLIFDKQPGGAVAGAEFGSTPIVVAIDAGGNRAADAEGQRVSMTISNGAPLAGETLVTMDQVSTTVFSGLSTTRAGLFRLTATMGQFAVTSNSFTITPDSVVELRYLSEPKPAAGDNAMFGGTPFGGQPQVGAFDQFQNLATNTQTNCRAVLSTNPTGARLLGNVALISQNGLCSFSDLAIDLVGTYVLTVDTQPTSLGDGAATSGDITVVAGPLAQARIVYGSTQILANLKVRVPVQFLDAGGNLFQGTGRLTKFDVEPAGTEFSAAATTVSIDGGLAFFDEVVFPEPGITVALIARVLDSEIQTPAFEAQIVIGEPTAMRRVPGSGGNEFSPSSVFQVSYELIDEAGNRVTSEQEASATLDSSSNDNVQLSGTRTVNIANGLFLFNDLTADRAGSLTLTATTTPIGGTPYATSIELLFTVGGVASLELVAQPGNGFPNANLQPDFTVQAIDSDGQVATDADASVTVTLSGAPAGVTIIGSGATTRQLLNGTARFTSLAISDECTACVLTATVDGSNIAISTAPFEIAIGPFWGVQFVRVPEDASAGLPFPQQPVVRLVDEAGNVVNDNARTVDLEIASSTNENAVLSGDVSRTAVEGIVTFDGLFIEQLGEYSLRASVVSSPNVALSPHFTVNIGPIAELDIVQGPPSVVVLNTALPSAILIRALDAGGNTVVDPNQSLRMSLVPSGEVSGELIVPLVDGVATFEGITIHTLGTYIFTVTSQNQVSSQTSQFDVAYGPPDSIVLVQQPADSTGGKPFPSQPILELKDTAGNTILSNNEAVVTAVILDSTNGDARLDGTVSVTVSGGKATFTDLFIKLPGTFTLQFTSPGVDPTVSRQVRITIGPPEQLVFSTQPFADLVSLPFSTQPELLLLDAGGNIVVDESASVALTFTPGPATAIAGTLEQQFANGRARFDDLGCAARGDFTFTATSGPFSTESTSMTCQFGPLSQLQLASQPQGSTGGSVFPSDFVVRLLDRAGNVLVDTPPSTTVEASIKGNTPATLSGQRSVGVANGVAVFSTLSIDRVGGYILQFVAPCCSNVAAIDSTDFEIVLGPLHSLEWTRQPSSSAIANVELSSQPRLIARDAGQNLWDVPEPLTIILGQLEQVAGAEPEALFQGQIINGIADFVDVSLPRVGDFRLVAVADASTGEEVVSDFSVLVSVQLGTLSRLAFRAQPSGGTAGDDLDVQPKVGLFDSGNNLLTSDSSTVVTLTVISPVGAEISGGTTSVQALAGEARFTGLRFNQPGTYVLGATVTQLPDTVQNSAEFVITVGPPSRLVFTVQPHETLKSRVFSQQPVVDLVDNGGNRVSQEGFVSARLTTGDDSLLTGNRDPQLVDGRAVFSQLAINAEGDFSLTVSLGGTFTAVSDTFTLTIGPPARLVVVAGPHNDDQGVNTGGLPFQTPVLCELQDAAGNRLIREDSVQVSLDFFSSSNSDARLFPTASLTRNVQAGRASFSDVFIDKTGSFQLVVSALNLAQPTGTFQVVVGPVAALTVEQQPSGGRPEVELEPPFVVAGRDAGGNLNTDSTSQLAIVAELVPAAGVQDSMLLGPSSRTLSEGIATFSGLAVGFSDSTSEGGNFRMRFRTAETSQVPPVESASFSVVQGELSAIRWRVVPSATGVAGQPFSVQAEVELLDASGAVRVLDSSSRVTLAIESGPPAQLPASNGLRLRDSETLNMAGTVTVQAEGGVVTFTDVLLRITGNYVVRASVEQQSGVAAITTEVAISTGPASFMLFTQLPPATLTMRINQVWSVQPVVTLYDTGGNAFVPPANGPIEATIAYDPVTPSLGGTRSISFDQGGTARFTDLIGSAEGLFALRVSASTAGVSAVSSPATVRLAIGPINALRWLTQPPTTTGGGETFPAQTRVEAVDDVGNRIVSENELVIEMLIISSTNQDGRLSNSVATMSNGVAVFTQLSLDLLGSYTLGVRDLPLTRFVLQADEPTVVQVGLSLGSFEFTVQPGGGLVNEVLTVQPELTMYDRGGNVWNTQQSFQVTATLAGGASGASLRGTTSVDVVGGRAAFTNLEVDVQGTYRLQCDIEGLTQFSSEFNVQLGGLNSIVVESSPSSSFGGATLAPDTSMSLRDSAGNVLPLALEVQLSVQSGPGPLVGELRRRSTDGLVSFGGLVLNTMGEYVISGCVVGQSPPVCTSFGVSVARGPAAELRILQSPTSGLINENLSPTLRYELLDAGSNRLVDAPRSRVVIEIPSSPTALDGVQLQRLVDGAVSFPNLQITEPGEYRIVARVLDDETDAPLDIISGTTALLEFRVGELHRMRFDQQLGTTVDSAQLLQQVRVRLEDVVGNLRLEENNDFVGLSVESFVPSDPEASFAAVLRGTLQVPVVAGLADFTDLRLDRAGTYTLLATLGSARVPGAPSPSIVVRVGPIATIEFATPPPASGIPNVASTGNVVVRAFDAGGNAWVPSSGQAVSIGLSLVTVSGATTSVSISSTSTALLSEGAATFGGFTIDGPGEFRVRAAAFMGGEQLPAEPARSDVVTRQIGQPDHLELESSDATFSTGGVPLSAQPVVRIYDVGGNLVTNVVVQVGARLVVQNGSTLLGTTQVASIQGVATFTNLAIDRPGTYTIECFVASNPSVSVQSGDVTITVGPPNRLAFVQQPFALTIGELDTMPHVAVQDAGGNTVSNVQLSITLRISPQAETSGSLTVDVNAAGVAEFTALSILTAGNFFFVAESDVGSASSEQFAVLARVASQILFVQQPTGARGGQNSLSLTIGLYDDDNELVVEDSSTQVQLSLVDHDSTGSALLGQLSTEVSDGLAGFSLLSINTVGTYSILVSLPQRSDVPGAESELFEIVAGFPETVRFVQQPVGGSAGLPLAQNPVLGLFDLGGNPAGQGHTDAFATLAFQPEVEPLEEYVSGELSGGFDEELAQSAFELTLLQPGQWRLAATVTVSESSLPVVLSDVFTVTFGQPSELRFSQQPSASVQAGVPFPAQPIVSVYDAAGNVIGSDDTTQLRISIASGPSGSSLAGETTRTSTSGSVFFSDLAIAVAGVYRLQIEAVGLDVPPLLTQNVTVQTGSVFELLFVQQPGALPEGRQNTPRFPISRQPVLQLFDRGGNLVLGATRVTLSVAAGGSAEAQVMGEVSVLSAGGQAVFYNIGINRVGTYRLRAESGGRSAVSEPFEISCQGLDANWFHMHEPQITGHDWELVGGNKSVDPFEWFRHDGVNGVFGGASTQRLVYHLPRPLLYPATQMRLTVYALTEVGRTARVCLVINEHGRTCTDAPASDGRMYRIDVLVDVIEQEILPYGEAVQNVTIEGLHALAEEYSWSTAAKLFMAFSLEADCSAPTVNTAPSTPPTTPPEVGALRDWTCSADVVAEAEQGSSPTYDVLLKPRSGSFPLSGPGRVVFGAIDRMQCSPLTVSEDGSSARCRMPTSERPTGSGCVTLETAFGEADVTTHSGLFDDPINVGTYFPEFWQAFSLSAQRDMSYISQYGTPPELERQALSRSCGFELDNDGYDFDEFGGNEVPSKGTVNRITLSASASQLLSASDWHMVLRPGALRATVSLVQSLREASQDRVSEGDGIEEPRLAVSGEDDVLAMLQSSRRWYASVEAVVGVQSSLQMCIVFLRESTSTGSQCQSTLDLSGNGVPLNDKPGSPLLFKVVVRVLSPPTSFDDVEIQITADQDAQSGSAAVIGAVKVFPDCSSDLRPNTTLERSVFELPTVDFVEPVGVCSDTDNLLTLTSNGTISFMSSGVRELSRYRLALEDGGEAPCQSPIVAEDGLSVACVLGAQGSRGGESIAYSTIFQQTIQAPLPMFGIFSPGTANLIHPGGWLRQDVVQFVEYGSSEHGYYLVQPAEVEWLWHSSIDLRTRRGTTLFLDSELYLHVLDEAEVESARPAVCFQVTHNNSVAVHQCAEFVRAEVQQVDAGGLALRHAALQLYIPMNSTWASLDVALVRSSTSRTIMVRHVFLRSTCASATLLGAAWPGLVPPTPVSVSPRVACVGTPTVVEVMANAVFGTEPANRVGSVSIAGVACEDLEFAGRSMRCTLAPSSSTSPGGQIQMTTVLGRAPNSGGSAGSVLFSVSDVTANFIGAATSWFLPEDVNGARCTAHINSYRPARNSLYPEALVLQPDTPWVETTVTLQHLPGSLTFFAHAVAAQGRQHLLYACVQVHFLDEVCVNATSLEQSNGYPTVQLKLGVPDVRSVPYQVRIRLGDRGVKQRPVCPFQDELKQTPAWVERETASRFFQVTLTDKGRCQPVATFTPPQREFELQVASFSPEVMCSQDVGPELTFNISVNLATVPYLDWTLLDRVVRSQGVVLPQVPWIPTVTVANLPCSITSFGRSWLACNMTEPREDTTGRVRVYVGGQVAVSKSRMTLFLCFNEPDLARLAERVTTPVTGTGLSLGVVGAVAAMSTMSLAAQANVAARSQSTKNAFRMIYYVQFIAVLSRSGGRGSYPESTYRFADKFAWLNGWLLPPWATCDRDNPSDRCDIPEDQLFAATVYWQVILALIVLASVYLLMRLVMYMWDRVPMIRERIDVATRANLPLVPTVVVIRLLLLGVNGVTVSATMQVVNHSGDTAATFWAVMFLLVLSVGLPLLNAIVVIKVGPGNPIWSESVKTKAEFAFGSLFGEYKGNKRQVATWYLVKRVVTAVLVGASIVAPKVCLIILTIVCFAYTLFAAWMQPFVYQMETRLHVMMEGAEAVQSLMFLLTLYYPERYELLTSSMLLTSLVVIVFIAVAAWNMACTKRAVKRVGSTLGLVSSDIRETDFDIEREGQTANKAIKASQSDKFGTRMGIQMHAHRSSSTRTMVPKPRTTKQRESLRRLPVRSQASRSSLRRPGRSGAAVRVSRSTEHIKKSNSHEGQQSTKRGWRPDAVASSSQVDLRGEWSGDESDLDPFYDASSGDEAMASPAASRQKITRPSSRVALAEVTRRASLADINVVQDPAVTKFERKSSRAQPQGETGEAGEPGEGEPAKRKKSKKRKSKKGSKSKSKSKGTKEKSKKKKTKKKKKSKKDRKGKE